MAIGIVLIGILLLILLIGYFKLNAFISFIVVSVLIGMGLGMHPLDVSQAVQKGIGNILGFLVVILGFGAMLGKIVADSGAAQRISSSLINRFGKKYVQWALVLTGFIVGIPMFYSVGFVVLVPLVFTIAASTGLPLLYIAVPMLASLSVTHGYLPPHPAPSALVKEFGANMSLTLLYGIVVAIPAIILGGPVFSRFLKSYDPKPIDLFFNKKVFEEHEMPGLGISIFTALLPVFLIGGSAILSYFIPSEHITQSFIQFIGDPIIAMLITVLVSIFTLGLIKGRTMKDVSKSIEDSIKSIAMILLIIAGSGALKQVLIDSGVSNTIGEALQQFSISPLILAWLIAATIRICVGSATVSGLTAAGIVFPLIKSTGADPNLMVLAIGAGSLMFSHVNDTGFWMFKEYFNLSVTDTLKTWSVMETIVSVVGLIGVLIINMFI